MIKGLFYICGEDSFIVGIPEDDCTIDNNAFNTLYSANSLFTLDLSEVRVACDNIDITAIANNAKFMCIYNKLAASPKI